MTDLLQAAAEAVELGKAATPGPWRVATQNGCRVWVDDGRIIIADAGRSLELRQLHKKANAALIAAAPSHVDLIRDLAAEVVSLRADAARYAWIRSEAENDSKCFEHKGKKYTSFDECIDAARTGDSDGR